MIWLINLCIVGHLLFSGSLAPSLLSLSDQSSDFAPPLLSHSDQLSAFAPPFQSLWPIECLCSAPPVSQWPIECLYSSPPVSQWPIEHFSAGGRCFSSRLCAKLRVPKPLCFSSLEPDMQPKMKALTFLQCFKFVIGLRLDMLSGLMLVCITAMAAEQLRNQNMGKETFLSWVSATDSLGVVLGKSINFCSLFWILAELRCPNFSDVGFASTHVIQEEFIFSKGCGLQDGSQP